MIWTETGNLEHWTQDDRFCVFPLPEGWLGIDYAPSENKFLDFSPPCETVNQAKEWCELRYAESLTSDPVIIVANTA